MRCSVNIVQPGKRTALTALSKTNSVHSDSVPVRMNSCIEPNFYLRLNVCAKKIGVFVDAATVRPQKTFCIHITMYLHIQHEPKPVTYLHGGCVRNCVPSHAEWCFQHISVLVHSLFAGKSCGRRHEGEDTSSMSTLSRSHAVIPVNTSS